MAIPSFLLVLLLLPSYPLSVLSANIVTHLPGFQGGALPFYLETGYVSVDEERDKKLFYYFIESEGNPDEDPLLLALTGGPGCSSLSGLLFEIGPLKLKSVKYDGRLPELVYFPHAWTKVASIIFLDSPLGTGFSFARTASYLPSDTSWSQNVHKFLLKWLADHPQFLSNPLYVSGESYAGKIIPVIAAEIVGGIEAGYQPILNFKGYLLGNPITDENKTTNSRVSFAQRMGVISDELYESVIQHCPEGDYINPSNSLCAVNANAAFEIILELNLGHILEPLCARASPKTKNMVGDRMFFKNEPAHILVPPEIPELRCRAYAYYLSYYWANADQVRKALNIQEGTVPEWHRCNDDLPYEKNIEDPIKYQLFVTSKGYRALIYSGDHDMITPHPGTHSWIKAMNFSVVDEWRSWSFGGKVAGYTRAFSNNLTFATVLGAGHTAPEYKPQECLAMFWRWISHQPL